MPLLLNLRHLERHPLSLKGELTAQEMELETLDDMIQAPHPLAYDLVIEKLEQSVLVRGRLGMALVCQCVRCLKSFTHRIDLRDWTCHIPLHGEEKAAVENDCVDLTPYLREDTLLAFPQRPLCGSGCGGLTYARQREKEGTAGESPVSSAWAELNKLKL
jgi:uncharacterized protein